MQTVKFRLADPGLKPRRTKLEMPGWGGTPQPRADGSHEQVWHCMPFTEGAQYGIEVFYPYANELRVTKKNGIVQLDGDFGPPPDEGLQWPPFRAFGENFYTYQLLLDLDVGPGFGVRTEPHPRFYADATDTVPVAVPALLRTEWWPMISFIVFKAPPEGAVHIFRPGEPMLQILILPTEPEFTCRRADAGGAGAAGSARPAHSCKPGNARQGFDLDLVDRHRFRRHLPLSAARRQNESARRLSTARFVRIDARYQRT